MRDYHAIFNKWSDYSIADLQLRNEVGAKIELATRLKDPALSASAIRAMDDDTYNIISAIKLLEGDNFVENVRRYESVLVPTLTIGRTIDLQFESDVLLYAVNKLMPVAQGLLGNIIKHLNILQNKVITKNSTNFKQLLSYHYSEFAICLLNYKWLRAKTSENSLKQLQSNLLSVLFEKETPFLADDKILIQDILRDHNVHWDSVKWSKKLNCAPVKNTENWIWLHSLCKSGDLSIECIKVDVLNEDYSDRFEHLNNYEKIICCNDALARARSKEAFEDALKRIDFEDFMVYVNEDLDSTIFNHAVDIGVIDLEAYSNDAQLNYVRGLRNKSAYEFFIKHPEVQQYEIIGSRWGFNASEYYKTYLNDDENRVLINTVLDIVYNQRENRFADVVCELLSETKITKLYSPELLKAIAQTLRETFKNDVSSYKINKMLRNVLGDEEYEIIQEQLREQEELLRLQRKEEQTTKSIRIINESFNKCNSFVELLAEYKEFIKSYRFENELVNKILLQTIEKYDDSWIHDDNYTVLYYKLWESNNITHDTFLQMVSSEREVV